MQVQVSIFGQLAEITGSDRIVLHGIGDTDALQAQLNLQYPLLKDYPYVIAVDKEIISSNTSLNDQCVIALLPPYAGG